MSVDCFQWKTAYELRISDWSSNVCSSDLPENGWFALTAARASKPLPQAGNRRRGADLRNALHGADVDAKLECCRTNGSCWPLLLFERRLGLLANFLRQATVMRPELVRHLLRFA